MTNNMSSWPVARLQQLPSVQVAVVPTKPWLKCVISARARKSSVVVGSAVYVSVLPAWVQKTVATSPLPLNGRSMRTGAAKVRPAGSKR